MLEIRRLDEKAKRALAAARLIVETAERENRDLTAEEDLQIDAYHAEADRAVNLRERLKSQEQIEQRDMEARERERIDADRRERDANSDPEREKKRYATAFRNMMRFGPTALPADQRAVLEGQFRALDGNERGLLVEALDGGEQRIMGTGVGGSPFGGYSIPEAFMNRVVLAMDAWNGVFRAPCEQFATASGAPMPWPTGDDRSVSGELLGEGSAAAGHADSTGDLVLSRVVFDAYTYSSKVVKVQRQLLTDEAIDLEGVLAGALGERLGRITGTHLTTGTGTAQPNGIVTAAGNSAVTISIAGGDPDYDDLVDIEATIAEPYRISPSCGWMFADGIYTRLRKQVDTTGQPLWNPGGVANNAPPTILGYRYYLNQFVPAVSGTNKCLLFGDLSRYKIRRVAGGTLLRLDERYAELLQVGFLAFLRLDGDLVDGGAGSIKYAAATT